MSQDILINKLLYSKDPFEDLNTVRPYYDSWYDNAIVIDTKAAKKCQERIPYHLKDLVVGYVRNNLTTSTFLPVLGRVNMIDEAMIGIMPLKVLSREVNEIGYPITKLYPICISNEILLTLGFKWDKRFNKFRLRLKDFRNIDIGKTSYSEACYIKEIGYIKYLHELQAVLRIYHIDQGILSNKLWVDNSLPGVDWVNNNVK